MKISRPVATIACLVVATLGVFFLWRSRPEQKVARWLEEFADHPAGLDIFWQGRSAEAIQADFDDLGTKALPALVKSLSHPRVFIRFLAARQLGRLGDRRAVDPLITSTRDAELVVRCWAVIALGDIGDSRAVDTLVPLVQHDDSDLRCLAAQALGKTGDKRAYEALLQSLEHDDLHTRAFATEAIGRLGDNRALALLLAALASDPDSDVQSAAANGLRYLGSQDAVPALTLASEDESMIVRMSAIKALEFLRQKPRGR